MSQSLPWWWITPHSTLTTVLVIVRSTDGHFVLPHGGRSQLQGHRQLIKFHNSCFQVGDVEDLHLYINYKFIELIAGRIRASASCSFMQSSGSRLPMQCLPLQPNKDECGQCCSVNEESSSVNVESVQKPNPTPFSNSEMQHLGSCPRKGREGKPSLYAFLFLTDSKPTVIKPN